jgi:hypothetical protein
VVFDLERAERACLAGQEIDHRVACPAPAVAGLAEDDTGVLSPRGSALARHRLTFYPAGTRRY